MAATALVLESCAKAVALGDGRDTFNLQPGGQLHHVASGTCVSVADRQLGEGVVVSLAGCDGASRWEVQGNGQLKLESAGDYCLSQEGVAPGMRDVAVNAAATASSAVNALSHG